MEPTQERWLPVVGYEGLYEVSDLGNLRSVDRLVWNPSRNLYRKAKGGPRGVIHRKDGYIGCLLHFEGRVQGFLVHRLVLAAFVGPVPPGLETRHINGNAHDNRLANLQYGTPLENGNDRRLHGTIPRGEASGRAKLTEAQVMEIRRARATTAETQTSLAARYGVSRGAITAICDGRSWTHLPAL